MLPSSSRVKATLGRITSIAVGAMVPAIKALKLSSKEMSGRTASVLPLASLTRVWRAIRSTLRAQPSQVIKVSPISTAMLLSRPSSADSK